MTHQEKNASIDQIVETLSQLSVLDLSKLKKALEEKWDVQAASASPVMVAAPAAEGGTSDETKGESTDFQVVLEAAPVDKKIAVIKVVREVTGLTLKEAKEMVEGAPKTIKDSAPKSEAEEIQKKFTDAGAKVSLKGV